MQYERSEDGIDYVNAFPISIQEDADLMPLMEMLLDKQLSSAKVFCSSVPEKLLSRLVITEKYDIILPDYHNMQIKMEPLIKAVFILFLRHEEGIVFKSLSDYREELHTIYLDICAKQESPVHLSAEKIRQSIDALTNPLSNSINEKCARVRAAFVSQFDESLAKYYYIDGKRGEAKKIILDRKLLEWKSVVIED